MIVPSITGEKGSAIWVNFDRSSGSKTYEINY